MKPFGPFPLSASATQDEDLDLSPIVDMLVVKNASPFILTVQPYQGSQVKIPPYWADLVPVSDFQGRLTFSTDAGLAANNAPISVALVDAYQRGERVLGTYPVPLSYLFNLGNNVPLNAQATSLANDGNVAGTEFIEATPAGGSKSVSVTNDGNASFAGTVKVGSGSGTNLELVGSGTNILPDNPGGIARGYSLYGWDGAFYQQAIQVNGDGSIKLHAGGGIAGVSIFSGTGTGTFAHGLGTTPRAVLAMSHVNGSQTMGWDSENSTTVHITAGAGQAWVALAIA